MKLKNDKSLEEVWEMKKTVYKKFTESKIPNFNEFMHQQIDEKLKNLNINFKRDLIKKAV